jgi:outer membrane protein assembly factor BamB
VSFFSDGRFIARFDAAGQALWATSPSDVPALVSADALGFVFTATAPAEPGSPAKIAKLGPGGQELWSVSLPVEVTALSPSGNGGVVAIAGFSGSFALGGASLESPANVLSDVVIVGLDGSGAVAWSSSIGATQPAPPEEGYAIVGSPDVAAMPSGGALVLATVVRGDYETPETGERVVQRLGANGQVIWERHLAVSRPSVRVVAAPEDGALLVGQIGSGQLNLGCTTHSARGILLQALDAAGQPHWERMILGNMGVSRPSFDAAGNLVLAGPVMGEVDFGGGKIDGHPGEFRIFVARYAPDGAHLASQTFQGTPPPGADWVLDGESRVESSAVDPAGHVLLTGFYSGALAFGPFALPDVPIAVGPYMTRGLIAKLTP